MAEECRGLSGRSMTEGGRDTLGAVDSRIVIGIAGVGGGSFAAEERSPAVRSGGNRPVNIRCSVAAWAVAELLPMGETADHVAAETGASSRGAGRCSAQAAAGRCTTVSARHLVATAVVAVLLSELSVDARAVAAAPAILSLRFPRRDLCRPSRTV